jgi:hypothetical protein
VTAAAARVTRVDTRPRSSVRVVVTPLLPPDAVANVDDEPSGNVAAQQDQSMLARVRARYEQRLERYERVLNGRAAPYLEVTNDNVKELVVLDGSLWQQLFDIYLYHGWDGIGRVDSGIRGLFQVTIPPTSVWAPARRFFEETRALLGGMVRDGLIELERASVARMTTNLSRTATAIENAWAHYGITRTVHTTTRPVAADAAGATFEEEVETFQFGHEAQTQALFESLTAAVQQRTQYEAELQRVANMRTHIQQLRATATRFRTRGRPLSSDAQLTRELDLKEAEAKRLEDKATAFYHSMLVVVKDHSPLGLLALEGLAPGFKRTAMEGLLGAMLWHTRARLSTLRGQVNAGQSKVRTLLPGTSFADLDGRQAASVSDALVVPLEGPERAVISAALDRFGKDGGWFPVLHEATLHQLAEAGEITPDSWLFVVWNRYVTALTRVLGKRRQDDDASAEFWSGFSKAAAAASLTLLVTPAAKVGVALRGAVAVADLVLLLHTVTSVTGQLAYLEELQNQQVVHPDAFSVEGLGRLGELGAYQRRLLEGMAQQVVIELALIAAGARWPVVKEALMLRGYLQDLETLLVEE